MIKESNNNSHRNLILNKTNRQTWTGDKHEQESNMNSDKTYETEKTWNREKNYPKTILQTSLEQIFFN